MNDEVSDAARKLGKKGGEKLREKYGDDYFREMGRKGGNATKRFGSAYYAAIGRRGIETQKRRLGLDGKAQGPVGGPAGSGGGDADNGLSGNKHSSDES